MSAVELENEPLRRGARVQKGEDTMEKMAKSLKDSMRMVTVVGHRGGCILHAHFDILHFFSLRGVSRFDRYAAQT